MARAKQTKGEYQLTKAECRLERVMPFENGDMTQAVEYLLDTMETQNDSMSELIYALHATLQRVKKLENDIEVMRLVPRS